MSHTIEVRIRNIGNTPDTLRSVSIVTFKGNINRLRRLEDTVLLSTVRLSRGSASESARSGLFHWLSPGKNGARAHSPVVVPGRKRGYEAVRDCADSARIVWRASS